MPASLPVELVEHIIGDLWSQDLSTHDRATFMKSSVLVNTTWANIFLGVSCKDVHIPSAGCALYFLSILRGESPFYNHFAQGTEFLDSHCRSISFQRDNNSLYLEPHNSKEHPMSLAIYAVFQALFHSPFTLPELRRVSIQYNNCLQEDLFTRNKFIGFPPQITDLELDFKYHQNTPPHVLDAIMSSQKSVGLVPGTMKTVRRLQVTGVSEGVISELAMACPNVEDFDVMEEDWMFDDDCDSETDEGEEEEDSDSETDKSNEGGQYDSETDESTVGGDCGSETDEVRVDAIESMDSEVLSSFMDICGPEASAVFPVNAFYCLIALAIYFPVLCRYLYIR